MSELNPVESEALLEDCAFLKRLARRLVHDPHRADDAAQEAWIRAVESRQRNERKGRGWLAAVLKNFVRQDARSRGRRAAYEERSARAEATPSAYDALERLALQRRVVEAVESLDEPFRSAIVMRFLDDLPPREIARRTNAPIKTVKGRIQRGLERLRTKLDDLHDGDRKAWLGLFIPLAGRPLENVGLSIGAGVVSTQSIVTLGLCGVVAAGAFALWPEKDRVAAERTEVTAFAADVDGVGGAGAETKIVDVPASDVAERVTIEPEVVPERITSMVAPKAVAGRVIDLEENGVGGALVVFRPDADEGRVLSATANATGDFFLEQPEDSGRLYASNDRWATLMSPYLDGFPAEPPVIVVAPSGSFAGTVVDPHGDPLAGATVRVGLGHEIKRSLMRGVLPMGVPDWETITDDSGAFALDGVGLAEGLYLSASLDGYITGTLDLSLRDDRDLEVRLEPYVPGADTVLGRVESGSGDPIAGAYVTFGELCVECDADGRFAIDYEGEEERAKISAVAPGFQPVHRDLDIAEYAGGAPGSEPLVLVLDGSALAIEGRVTNAEGRGLSMVKVWTLDAEPFGRVPEELLDVKLLMDRSVEEMMREERGELEVFTEKGGAFRLEGLQKRAYRILALHPITAEVVDAGLVEAGTSTLSIVLPGGRNLTTVAGRVVALDGRGLSNLEVSVIRSVRVNGDVVGEQRVVAQAKSTDNEGRFELRPMSTEDVYLHVSGKGVQEVMISLVPGVDPENLLIEVAARCHFKVDLSEPDSADSVHVLDENGKRISLTLERASGLSLMASGFGFTGGGSEVLVADERARTVILEKAGEEVARIAVTFESSGVNSVRW